MVTRELPKTIGILFDWGREDYQALTGVPVSAVHFETWDRVSPGPGQFNAAALDAVMARYRGQTVTLLDGTVISKPVVTQLMAYISGAPDQPAGVDFSDRTPRWVYAEGGVAHTQIGDKLVGYAVPCSIDANRVAEMPRYDSAQWWDYWWQTVRQFAAWAEGQPQIVGVVAWVGLDGETQPIKNWQGCAYQGALMNLPGVEYRWGQNVTKSLDVYGEAFEPTGLTWWLNNAPGGRARPTRAAEALAAGGSLKHSGGVPDVSYAHGLGTIAGTGSWDYMRDNRAVSSNAWESAYDIGNAESKYWSLYAMLGVGWPAAMDLHSGYFPGVGSYPVDTAFLRWAVSYLGYSPRDGPGAWIVFRDAEEPCQGEYCWWPGDFSMGATRVRGGEARVWRASLPADDGTYPGRQARMVTDELSIDLDDALLVSGSRASLVVTLLNYGTDTVAVGYHDVLGVWTWTPFRKGPELGPVNSWITVTIDAPKLGIGEREDIRVLAQNDGPEYLHKIEVRSGAEPLRTPTPTGQPTFTPMPEPSATYTATPTRTATPSPLWPYPTYTPYPTLTAVPTWTPLSAQGHLDAAQRQLEYQNPGWEIEIGVSMRPLP